MTEPRGNVHQTGWAFVGFLMVGKGSEQRFPIGVYTKYCDGAAQANAWQRQEKRAIRWEGTKLYEECDE
jgi:hypothetical protein